MKQNIKRLKLRRETVRGLDDRSLGEAFGGTLRACTITCDDTCPRTCQSCCAHTTCF